jgi:hypothetical protein
MTKLSENEPEIINEFEKFIMNCANPFEVKLYHERISTACVERLSGIYDIARGNSEIAQSKLEDAKECVHYINQFNFSNDKELVKELKGI